VKVLVIGCGSIGRRHIANLRALGHDVQITDVDPEAVARVNEEPGWTASTTDLTLEAAQGTSPFASCDAVMICTPAATHAAVARQIYLEGYRGPLFVEKPLVLDLESAEIFRTWPHPVTQVGYNWRFHPDIRPLMAIPSAGVSLHLDCRTNIAHWPGRDYADPWLECSHEIDLACAWLGDPTSVVSGPFIDPGDDTLMLGGFVQMQHPDRSDSLIDLRWAHQGRPEREYHVFRRDGSRHRLIPAIHPDAAGLQMSYHDELAHFLDAVHLGVATMCPFSDGLRVVGICEHARRMAA